ncbi:MAG: pseudouridine synthase [Spirochaetales bacterium]|nr:pseudouridine synthase [Spirochaetales bacterium]
MIEQRKKETPKIYIIMNKPEGYVCSAVSDSHKTVYELLPSEFQELVQNAKRGERLHTIGRLDCNTSGLLIFTNDGIFSHNISAPEKHINKIYEAELKNSVLKEEQIIYQKKALQGLVLPAEKKYGEQKSSPMTITFKSESKCFIELSEGKFHQVKRTFSALGNEVIKLCRIKIGKLELNKNLKPGDYKILNHPPEI